MITKEEQRKRWRVSQQRHRDANREAVRKYDREAKRIARGGTSNGLLMDRATAFKSELAKLSEGELGYLAGLVDGEGTVSIKRIGDKQMGHYAGYFGCDVSVANTDIGIINWLTTHLPTSKVKWQYTKDPRFKSHKPVARWYVCGRRAAALCEAIEPYLRTVKRQRARLLRMLLAERPYNGRQITLEEIERRNRIYKQFTEIGG